MWNGKDWKDEGASLRHFLLKKVAKTPMYIPLLRFLLPLVITDLLLGFGSQLMNGGMARMPRATETLAAYGLAWGVAGFLTSTLSEVRQLSLSLVENRQALRTVLRCVHLVSGSMAALLACVAFTPVGVWVIEDLHGVDPGLGTVVREALSWLIPVPLLAGLSRLLSGLLMRVRRTDALSYATLAGIGANILAVFALLPTALVEARPILLPIIVTYAGAFTELAVLLYGVRRHVRPRLPETEPAHPPARRAPLTPAYVFRFFWPLAVIMGVQGVSRPLVNLFVAREPDSAAALAVLTVVYALAHLPYGWLNNIKNLAPAFQHQEGSLANIRRFAAGCGLLSFAVMILMFWTPLRWYLLESLIGVDHGLALHCTAPLVIFSFFPMTVMVRAYYHGVALLEHRTAAMAPSGPARIAAIAGAMAILSLFDLEGATRGVAALFCGFFVETVVVWWGVKNTKGKGERAK
jgi:hypothetical protein